MDLIEIGKRLSTATETQIRAAIDALQALLDAGSGDASATEALRRLQEAAMSFDEIKAALRNALQSTLPAGSKVYYYIPECYSDYFIYEQDVMGESGLKYFKRSYSIVDGVVTLGDPTEVRKVTSWEPVGTTQESARLAEVIKHEGAKWVLYSKDGKKRLGEFDSKEAAQEREREIQAFKHMESADSVELVGDLVPLVERAVRKDGTVPIKVIAPGWGSSGYYSAEMLKRDGPKAFKSGLHMFVDHPTAAEEAERPERSVNGLGAVLASDAKWLDNGPAGPGLYADAKPFSPFKERLDELAPHIGVSIRALGTAKQGEAEGRKGPIIEGIAAAKSVDFVTLPGAGGQVLQLFEAARGGQTIKTTEVAQVNEQEAQALREAAAAREAENTQLKAELARLREAALLAEARAFVVETLKPIDMPELTRARLTESLAKAPVVKDGALDRDAYKTAIDEAVKAELEYLGKVTGSGVIRGMGASAPAGQSDHQTVLERWKELYRDQGYSLEEAAKLAEISAR